MATKNPMGPQTKASRAAALVRRIQRGPDFTSAWTGGLLTPDEAAAQYRAWASSWITPELRSLIPQLQPKKK